MINIYLKDSDTKLNRFLNSNEMDCKCDYSDCQYTYIEESTAFAFHQVRTFIGRSLSINSGYRCEKHNKDVGGVEASKHLIGHAVDIRIPEEFLDDEDRLDYLIEMCETFFDTVILYIGRRFIHCHMEPETELRRQ